MKPPPRTEAERIAGTRALLSEGLDLCVRARKLDAIVRGHFAVEAGVSDFDRYADRHNAMSPDQPVAMTRSGTPALWVQDQYEHDLADWERRVRAHLLSQDQTDER